MSNKRIRVCILSLACSPHTTPGTVDFAAYPHRVHINAIDARRKTQRPTRSYAQMDSGRAERSKCATCAHFD